MTDSPWTQLAQRTREAAFGYSLLELAQSEHQKTPAELNEQEHQAISIKVEDKLKLEDEILGSSIAAKLPLPVEAHEKAMSELLSRFTNPEEYQQSLQEQGFTEEQHRLATERAVAVNAVLAEVQTLAPRATEEDLRTIYHQQPKAFARPERRKARHILHVCGDEIDNLTGEQKLREVRQKLEQLIANEATPSLRSLIAKTAEMHSQCPSALKGGLLGIFPRGVLYPELDEALFSMTTGQIAGPLRTEAGWHLLFLEAVEPADTMPYSEAREKIATRVNTKLAQDYQRKWLAEHKPKA